MSVKKVVLALALSAFTGIAWLGLSASPAAAASPTVQLTKFDKEVSMFAHKRGKHHGHHGHKGHKGHKHHKSKS